MTLIFAFAVIVFVHGQRSPYAGRLLSNRLRQFGVATTITSTTPATNTAAATIPNVPVIISQQTSTFSTSAVPMLSSPTIPSVPINAAAPIAVDNSFSNENINIIDQLLPRSFNIAPLPRIENRFYSHPPSPPLHDRFAHRFNPHYFDYADEHFNFYDY